VCVLSDPPPPVAPKCVLVGISRVWGPCVGCATYVHRCVGYEVLSEKWYGAVVR